MSANIWVQRGKLLQGTVLVHPLRYTLQDGGQLHIPNAPNSKQSIGKSPCIVLIEGRERQALLEVPHDGLEASTMVKHCEHVRIPHQPPDGGEVTGEIDLKLIFDSRPTLANMLEQDESVD